MKPVQLNNLAGVQVHDVEIEQLISEGGMGVAYRAYQHSLKRDVCIKLMRSQLVADDDWLQRFNREAAALSELRHSKHVVNVYFTDTLYGVYPYICMEFIEGRSLRSIINDEQPADWRRVCAIFLQICDTLADVHDAGIVHRDLKPDNVMVATEPPDFVKILDFGLCAMMQQNTLTKPSDLIGSVHYMAPECFSGSSRGSHVDIYAIGCMLYESLVGVPPFTSDTTMGVAFKHANEQIPALPDSIASELERQFLNAFIQKACAKDVTQRFTGASEMSVVLRQILGSSVSDTVVRALQPSKAKRRHRATVMLAIFVVSGLVYQLFQSNWLALVTGFRSWCTSSAVLRQEAERRYKEGQYEKAATLWRDYLSRHESQQSDLLRVSSLLSLADCHIQLSNPDPAIPAITEALQLLSEKLNVRKATSARNFAARDTLALQFLPDKLTSHVFWKTGMVSGAEDDTREAEQNLLRVVDLLHRPVQTAPPSRVPRNLTATLGPIDLNKQFAFLNRINQTQEGTLPDLCLLLAELEFRQRHYETALLRLEIFEPPHHAIDPTTELWREVRDSSDRGRQQLAFLKLCQVELESRASGIPHQRRDREFLTKFMMLVGDSQPEGTVHSPLLIEAADLIEILYQRTLGRSPDSESESDWAVAMLKKGAHYRDLVKTIVNNSPNEFRKSVPSNRTEIVPFLYKRLLNRSYVPGEDHGVWSKLLKEQGVDAVIERLLDSPEFELNAPFLKITEQRKSGPVRVVIDTQKAVSTLSSIVNDTRLSPNKRLESALLLLDLGKQLPVGYQFPRIVAKPGSYLLASRGWHVTAEAGSFVTAQAGSKVEAKKGASVWAEKGSQVTAESGSCVRAQVGSKIHADRGAKVTAEAGSLVTF